MRNLTELLKRITNSLDKDSATRSAVASCIHEVLGFDIDQHNISIKEDTLIIKASPAKKNEIKLREEQILKKLEGQCRTRITRIFYS